MRNLYQVRPPEAKPGSPSFGEAEADHDSHAQGRQFFPGQTVMAKNLRPGPNWIPAVVVERLGPLSYLVETEDRELWRRHVDLLKELAVPDYRPPSGTGPGGGAPAGESPGGPDLSTGDVPTPPPVEEQQEPERPVDLDTDPTSAAPSNTGAGSESPSTSSAAPARSKQYPRRICHPPNYYRPSN